MLSVVDVVDGQGNCKRKTICENCSQLHRENEELIRKNDRLVEEKKVVEKNEVLAVRREKGERLLRIGYTITTGGGERVSVM